MDQDDRDFIELLFTKQGEQFQQAVHAISESFDLKIGLLAEGHQSLAHKLDRVEARVEQLDAKIDGVELRLTGKLNKLSADLAAHRSDTEAHGNIYSVKERGD